MDAGALPVGTAKDRLEEMVAVGFPPAIFRKPNFAEAVEVPPIKRSIVLFPGYRAPKAEFQKLPPLAVGRIPDTSAARSTLEKVGAELPFPCKSVLAAPWAVWANNPPVPLVYTSPLSVDNPEKVIAPEEVRPVAAATAPLELT